MSKTVVLTVRFRKWRRKQPWTCLLCQALTHHPKGHAMWHASERNLCRQVPPDPGVSEKVPLEVTYHIGADGWPLR